MEVFSIQNKQLDKNRILLLALCGDTHPFTGESAGVNAISGYMQRHHPEICIDVLDLQLDKPAAVIQYLKTYRPAILGVSMKLKTFRQWQKLKDSIYENISPSERPLIVLGNALPAYYCENLLREYEAENVICFGEGEIAIEDLYLYINNKKDLNAVRNIMYLDQSRQIMKNASALVPEDRLSTPDRRRSLEFYSRSGIVYLETSRGCPWRKCSICSGSRIFDGPDGAFGWRPLPLDQILTDLERIQGLGIKIVRITDEDLLGGSRQSLRRAREFAKAKIKQKNTIKFDSMARVSSVYRSDDSPELRKERIETLALLKEAGLVLFYLGVESYSPTQLKRYHKGTSLSEIQNACKLVRDLNIPLNIGFIPCDPLMSLSELAETMQGIPEYASLLETSVSFHELRIQEGTPYVKLIRKEEKRLNRKLLGDLDINSLNYPVLTYMDHDVDKYVQSLRQFYNETNYYRIIFLLRTLTGHTALNSTGETHSLKNTCLTALNDIRSCDYQLSLSIIRMLELRANQPDIDEIIGKLIGDFRKESALRLIDLAKQIKDVAFDAEKKGQISSLYQEIMIYSNE